MEVVYDAMAAFVGQKCANTLVVKHDILNAPCLKLLLSKALGYAIIAGSLICAILLLLTMLTVVAAAMWLPCRCCRCGFPVVAAVVDSAVGAAAAG